MQHRFGIGEQNGGEYLEIEASKTDITSSDAVISERLVRTQKRLLFIQIFLTASS